MTEEILDHSLNSLVEGILDSYDKYPLIRNIDSSNRINRAIVLDILENLRKIIFPGYFVTRNLKQNSLSYHVGEVLEDIHYNLIKPSGLCSTGKKMHRKTRKQLFWRQRSSWNAFWQGSRQYVKS